MVNSIYNKYHFLVGEKMKPNLQFAYGEIRTINIDGIDYEGVVVYQVDPVVRQVAIFTNKDFDDAIPMAGDYTSFLNDKYVDKIICCEWPKISRARRIAYHKEQIRLLENEKQLCWSWDGNAVKAFGTERDIYVGQEVDYEARITLHKGKKIERR